jgi:hypothetical protein
VAGVALAVAAIALAVRYVPITHRVVPPLFAVNHVLTRGCAATAVRTLSIKDSLVADIQLPN